MAGKLQEARRLLDAINVFCEETKTGLLSADAVECASALIYRATRAGVTLLNGLVAEDLAMAHDRLVGVVINWSAALDQKPLVDPLTFKSSCE
ncbi:MAG: hypothetical protein ACLFO5_02755 [Opitutales bacterium]